MMNTKTLVTTALIVVAAVLFAGYSPVVAEKACMCDSKPVEKRWTEQVNGKTVKYMTIDGVMVHEKDTTKQPLPTIVVPGTASTQEKAGQVPSDAVVLFDGTKESMDLWRGTRPKHPNNDWKLMDDGAMEVVSKAGSIKTKEGFGSCQLHLEWMMPDPPNCGYILSRFTRRDYMYPSKV